MQLKSSNVFARIEAAKTRIVVNEGSSRSTKTFSLIQKIIIDCIQEPQVVTISRARHTWLKKTVMVDFFDILKNHFDLYNPKDHNKSDSAYLFPNGSLVEFIGLDEPQKLHGRKQDVVWINEAVETKPEDFRQFALRTKKRLYLDYNPSYEQHWIYDTVIPRQDCTLIHSTYKDNPFLDHAIVEEIERLEPTPRNIEQGTADETSWKIYGLGIRAAHRGLIFDKTKICERLPDDEHCDLVAYGLDFGFTNDPTALVKIRVYSGNLYFEQLLYERGLVNRKNPSNPNQKSIEGELERLGIPKSARIWADAAEPKSILDIQNAGWLQCNAADKGPDSVRQGIDIIRRYNSFIHEGSLDMIKERNNYKWREDKKGNPTNEPVKGFDHAFDAARYCCFMELADDRRSNPYKVYTPSSTMPKTMKEIMKRVGAGSKIKESHY